MLRRVINIIITTIIPRSTASAPEAENEATKSRGEKKKMTGDTTHHHRQISRQIVQETSPLEMEFRVHLAEVIHEEILIKATFRYRRVEHMKTRSREVASAANLHRSILLCHRDREITTIVAPSRLLSKLSKHLSRNHLSLIR